MRLKMKGLLESTQVVFQDYNSRILVTDGNILRIMPHPKRAYEALLGSKDCRFVLGSGIESSSKSSGYSKA